MDVIIVPTLINSDQNEEVVSEFKRVLRNSQSWPLPDLKICRSFNESRPDVSRIIVYSKSTKEIVAAFPTNIDSQKGLSLTDMRSREIYMNTDRFFTLPPNAGFVSLREYRNYIINHEMGHAIGLFHPELPSSYILTKCPVMAQQTLGAHRNLGYLSNGWPLESERNEVNRILRIRERRFSGGEGGGTLDYP